MNINELLDPVIIARLKNLLLRPRRVLEGIYSGRHLNRIRGSSREFSEHRPYIPGDDPKGLDWKIFGRTDRMVVRQYEEETNIGGVIVIDDSNSMCFSSASCQEKLSYAKATAAALGYLLISQNDAVSLVSNACSIPMGSQKGHLDRFLEGLSSLRPQGVWDIQKLTQDIQMPLKKRSLIIVLSDLMANTEVVISALRTLQARKHEIIVFHVLDPSEIDLNIHGTVLFEDAETKETIQTEPDQIRSQYKMFMEEWIASLAIAFRSSGIDYCLLTTDMRFDKGLGAYLSRRGGLI